MLSVHRDLTALLWTVFKHRDVRRGTKQEIPDLTRVRPGDWKAVSPPCSGNLSRAPARRSLCARIASSHPGDKQWVQVLEEEHTLPTTSIPPNQRGWRIPTNCQAVSGAGPLTVADIQGPLSS